MGISSASLRKIGFRRHRIELGPLVLDEAHVLAQGMRDDQDVGEHDRGVEAEAADRLQRHLFGKTRRVAEIEKRTRLFAGLAIFGQIASRLPHDPDRQRPDRFAVEHAENRF